MALICNRVKIREPREIYWRENLICGSAKPSLFNSTAYETKTRGKVKSLIFLLADEFLKGWEKSSNVLALSSIE